MGKCAVLRRHRQVRQLRWQPDQGVPRLLAEGPMPAVQGIRRGPSLRSAGLAGARCQAGRAWARARRDHSRFGPSLGERGTAVAVDLVAIRPTADCEPEFSTGWQTWGALLALLDELGADTSSAGMTNDGRVVTDETSRDWARRLETVIGRIDYVTLGAEFVFVVDGVPVGSASDPDKLATYLELTQAQSQPAGFLGAAETDEFVGHLVAFFVGCGGFEQW